MLRAAFAFSLTTALVGAMSQTAYASPLLYWSYSSEATGFAEGTSATPVLFGVGSISIRSTFGDVGVSVTSAESSAAAAWRDEWTITGGTGSGLMTVEWHLDGSLIANANQFELNDPSVTYSSLFGSTSVFSFGTPLYSFTQTTAGTHAVNLTQTLQVPFTYGVQFGAGFRLSGGVADGFSGGSMNFFNSGTVTNVILPDGATLRTASGATYPLQALTPVPEPSTLILVGSAFVGLLALRRRRRAE